jgi:hypothetical protein
MRIGFETTVNACGIRLSGRPKWREPAAGHGTAVTGFPGRMKRRDGAAHVLRRAPVPHREGSRAFLCWPTSAAGKRRRTALGERLRSELAAEPYDREPPPCLEGVAVAFRRLGDAGREILTLAVWEGLDVHRRAGRRHGQLPGPGRTGRGHHAHRAGSACRPRSGQTERGSW